MLKLKKEGGQTLIELLIAIALFIAVVSALTYLILDSYVAGRVAKQATKANFLAEEGIEAVISIRDNDWSGLAAGDHGLAISGNNWVLQGTLAMLELTFRVPRRFGTIWSSTLSFAKMSFLYRGSKTVPIEC